MAKKTRHFAAGRLSHGSGTSLDVLVEPWQWQNILDGLAPAPFRLWRQVKERLDNDFDQYTNRNWIPGRIDNILPNWLPGTRKLCFTRATELKKIMDRSIGDSGATEYLAIGLVNTVDHQYLLLFYKYEPPYLMDLMEGMVREGVWRYDSWAILPWYRNVLLMEKSVPGT